MDDNLGVVTRTTVGSLVPTVFDAYARILYPALDSTPHPMSPKPDAPSRNHLAALLEILTRNTETPDECWFALWEGNTALDDIREMAPTSLIAGYNYFLLKGPVSRATDTLGGLSPNLWWPADHAWCMAQHFDFPCAYLGGSTETVADILALTEIDSWPSRVDQIVTANYNQYNDRGLLRPTVEWALEPNHVESTSSSPSPGGPRFPFGPTGKSHGMSQLPAPPSIADGFTTADVVDWVAEHLGDLTLEGANAITPGGIRGGQSAADAALAGLDITGYARDRSTVLPVNRRGASRMSPYIRHGLLTLREVWDAVADAPPRDRSRYRDELMWQEYARHLYARTGSHLGRSLRREQPRPQNWTAQPWPEEMNCMSSVVGELHEDGWLVNQTRMWLASQWTVRAGATWRDGEDEMFAHLLDGSRAANRLGWQWTVGTGSGKVYGFSRWQVNKRAPSLCRNCALKDACPIENWPDDDLGPAVDGPDLNKAPIPAGPVHAEGTGAEQVWLTAESLGTADPALAADTDRPAVFVFDEPLLRKLMLSGKRLVFLAETLGEIASTRPLEVRRGRVPDELSGRTLAATWAPVPGFSRIADAVAPAELHPWPWLVRPTTSSVRSFSAWRRSH